MALGEISPTHETTTTFDSTTSLSGDRADLSGTAGGSLRSLCASDFDLRSLGSTGPRSRKKKKLPEHTAPDERFIFDGGRGPGSRRASPRSPRSLNKRGSKSDTALQDMDTIKIKKSSSGWDQAAAWDQADIRHIDSSLSTIHSENEKDESIGDILTKSCVTVIIEHVNDNDQEQDLKDAHVQDTESDTAKDNLNNNIEGSDKVVEEVKASEQQSESEKESDTEQMDTKVTDSEPENEKDNKATGATVTSNEEDEDNYRNEQLEFVVIKKRKRSEDSDEGNDTVVVIEKTIDDSQEDVSKSMSDVMSENLSDYNEPTGDMNASTSDTSESSEATLTQPPARIREHKEINMDLVLEGYYKYEAELREQGETGEDARSEASDLVHDSGINTPDLTTDIDPLSPTEKDFCFSKYGEFDDTFSEIFYDAENDFETSSRAEGPLSSSTEEGPGDFDHRLPLGTTSTFKPRALQQTMDTTTSLRMVTPQDDEYRDAITTTTVAATSADIVHEIQASLEHDRKLVAAILDQKEYAEIIELEVPEDLKLPHEKLPDSKLDTASIYSTTLSICSECSLTREGGRKKKSPPGSPKRRSRDTSDIGLPVCSECKCTIAHYSYGSKEQAPVDHLGYSSISSYCDVVFSDSALRAMQFNLDTLDKEGPGFIFVMAESLTGKKTLPWAAEQRYKIASSRHPEKWILEFRSRNIEVDVVWQIRVQNHIRAVKEVHASLQQYNLHSNWFRCSLAVIIESVLNIASKYRVSKDSRHSTFS